MNLSALRSRVSSAYRTSLDAGHIIFAPTTLHKIHDKHLNLDFHVLIAPSLAKKDKPKIDRDEAPQAPIDRKKPKYNPFLPYDRNQYVSDLSPTHVLLLNKFPVIAEHVLVVTKEFLLQDEPIDLADFDALIPVMHAMADSNPLAFYNCGPESGSSQPHRHIQVIPQQQPCPIDVLVQRHPGASRIPNLPYMHFLIHFSAPPTLGSALHSAYMSLLNFLSRLIPPQSSIDPPNFSHNVLITNKWMMVIPRLREKTTDGWMGVNAVGYSGSVLVTREEQLQELEERGGVVPVLVDCGYSWLLALRDAAM